MYDWQRMQNWGDDMSETPRVTRRGSCSRSLSSTASCGRTRSAPARAPAGEGAGAAGAGRPQIAKEVSQAALLLDAAEKSIQAARRGLSLAEEQFRVAHGALRQRAGIQLEILDAQATLTRSRFNIVSALAGA